MKRCEMELCNELTLNQTDRFCPSCEDMIDEAKELKREMQRARRA